MKKVIFICLLSLSVCLSKSNPTQEAQLPPAGPSTNASATDVKVPAAPEHPKAVPTTTQTTNAIAPVTTPTPQTKDNTIAKITSQTVTTPNETLKINENKPAEKNNATDNKADKDAPKPIDDKKVLPPLANNETKPGVPSDKKANNGTNPDSKDGKKDETTTPKAEVVSSTTAPVPVEAKSRAFDGPSFIGGIILTLGLLAIGFMGFKYYKNQTERNYHTL